MSHNQVRAVRRPVRHGGDRAAPGRRTFHAGQVVFAAGALGNVPMTAQILGGAAIGATAAEGVVDAYHRVFGHPGLHVLDGAAVSANPGVNPALTITAQAERAMAVWPNRAEPDPRPPLGSGYRRLDPVPPHHPAVPPGATMNP